MIYESYYPFEVLELPFGYGSLEPDIGEYTMFFHYNEHYLPTMKSLNETVKSMPLCQMTSLGKLAESDEKRLSRTAGAAAAHTLYFMSLTDKISEPSELMKERIASDFGTKENFLASIKDAAEDLYGSGFVWIAENKGGVLVPLITKEHNIPDTEKYRPVYALDLWEHAYYPDRPNRKSEYVDAALRHINWDSIESLLK